MNRYVEITFDCLPLRSVTRLDVPIDASPKYQALCERIKQAIATHGTHNTYYLYNARCAFHLTNHPEVGSVEFSFEGTVMTDPGDQQTITAIWTSIDPRDVRLADRAGRGLAGRSVSRRCPSNSTVTLRPATWPRRSSASAVTGPDRRLGGLRGDVFVAASESPEGTALPAYPDSARRFRTA